MLQGKEGKGEDCLKAPQKVPVVGVGHPKEPPPVVAVPPSPSGASGRLRSTQLISELVWLAMLELRLPMPERLPMTRGSSKMIFLEPGTLT